MNQKPEWGLISLSPPVFLSLLHWIFLFAPLRFLRLILALRSLVLRLDLGRDHDRPALGVGSGEDPMSPGHGLRRSRETNAFREEMLVGPIDVRHHEVEPGLPRRCVAAPQVRMRRHEPEARAGRRPDDEIVEPVHVPELGRKLQDLAVEFLELR